MAIEKFQFHAYNTDAVRKLNNKNILIASELSSLNFDSTVRAELSFAIHYPNVVFKSLCGNLDDCLNYHAKAYNFGRRPRPKDRNFKLRFLVALLNKLADFATEFHFSPEKSDHTNAPIII